MSPFPLKNISPKDGFVFAVRQGLESLKARSLLLAVSGGRDSMALMYVFAKLRDRFGFQLSVVHAHHGRAISESSQRARDQASRLVLEQANALEMKAYLCQRAKSEAILKSEDDLRRWRLSELRKTQQQQKIDFLVFAHHREDLFETRLMRLCRGTGFAGLPAMRVQQKQTLRPFLPFGRDQIEAFVRKSQIPFIEDPSNQDIQVFRNWLRHRWLPELDVARPGARDRLMRSLELLVEESRISETLAAKSEILKLCLHPDGLDRRLYSAARKDEQRWLIAMYVRELNPQIEFTRSQVEEVQKRLTSQQKNLGFKVGPLRWDINAQRILAFADKSLPQ